MATPLPVRDDHRVRVAKRAHEERSLAMRRRRGPASSSSLLGCIWVAAATAEDHSCCREEAAAVGAGAEAEETAMVDSCFVAYGCNRDVVAFDPPPMATPLLPLTAFITDLLKAQNDDRVAKRARDGDLLPLSEEADARGWSSAVPERSFALRRRRGPASSSSRRGCGWVADTADELCGRPEEAATPDAVGSGPTAAY